MLWFAITTPDKNAALLMFPTLPLLLYIKKDGQQDKCTHNEKDHQTMTLPTGSSSHRKECINKDARTRTRKQRGANKPPQEKYTYII